VSSVVIDASVLLQVARLEPGYEKVLPRLYHGKVSAVNLAEALNVLVRDGVPPAAAEAAIRPLARHIMPFTPEHAFEVAAVRAVVGKGDFSLGDAACIAVARVGKAPVLTNDRAWAGYDFGVSLEFGRPHGKGHK
jgi:PIN domain nuclease of toxin-antitoxin system